MVTALVCQAELFSQTAHQLDSIINTLPDQRVVQQIRQRIRDFEAQGGIQGDFTAKPTGLAKSFSILAKAVPVLNATAESPSSSAAKPPPPPPSEAPLTRSTPVAKTSFPASAPNPFADSPQGQANPFASEDDSFHNGINAPCVEPSAPPTRSGDPKVVEALYDHEVSNER